MKRLLDESHSNERRVTISINDLLRRVEEQGQALLNVGVELTVSMLLHDAYTQIDTEEVLRAFDKLIENSMDSIKEFDQWVKEAAKVWIMAYGNGETPKQGKRPSFEWWTMV